MVWIKLNWASYQVFYFKVCSFRDRIDQTSNIILAHCKNKAFFEKKSKIG